MKTVVHPANSRGHANHGWLNSYHSFSFGNYYQPEKMRFGALRVLNDDTVAAGKGFGMHPHQNMEIISIPLAGDLEHQDTLGNTTIIRAGDVQVMSAGTGILHSEYNKNNDKAVEFLQIWVLPKEKNVVPRYDQISLETIAKPNAFYQIASPNVEDQGIWLHQDAWLHLGEFQQETTTTYQIQKEENGVYLFVLEGKITVQGNVSIEKRDAIGIWNTSEFQITTNKETKALLLEVPMLP